MFEINYQYMSTFEFSMLEKIMFDITFDVRSFEAKNRVFDYDHQYMNTFQFIQCSKNDVQICSMFKKSVFDP